MSDQPNDRINKMMQDADENNTPAHQRPLLVMALLRQFGNELVAMTDKRTKARDEAVKLRFSLQMANETTKCLQEQLAAMTAAKELAERQVGEMASHIANNVPCWFCPLANADGDCGAGTCVAKVCAWSRAEAAKGAQG